MASENEPNSVVEKAKWLNRLDEAYVLLFLPISLDLLFHLDGLTTPNKVWTKLESLFGVQDDIIAYQFESGLFSLSPSSFDSIEGVFTKFSHFFYCSRNVGFRRRHIN